MTHTFKERISLRKLRAASNSKLFGQQNSKLGNILKIDPAWIHQSRLNYKYIFNSLDSFWPDWAKNQFNPFSESSEPPESELSCLNKSTRSTFTYLNGVKSHRLDINELGFISYPFLNWGISLKFLENDVFTPFFNSTISLDRNYPILTYSNQDDQQLHHDFKLSFDEKTSLTSIEITFKNRSDKLLKKSLNIGMIPYTNEGIGSIRSIQYTSNQQMIINDSSIV